MKRWTYLLLPIILSIGILSLASNIAIAALSGSSHLEIRASATAGNVNGGGFNPSNANFLTDLACDANTGNTATPIVSSASYNFVDGDEDAWIYVKAGTNWTPGFYQITSVAANKATLNAAVGAAVQYNSTTWMWGASTVAGVATVATPTGGTFGIDYSQQDAAEINNTDLACPDGDAASPTVTSAGSPFGVNHVGNFIHITAGAGYTADWYEIVSVSGSTATIDRAIGTNGAKTGGTFYVGGAISLASNLDDDILEKAVAGMRFWIKNGSYTTGESISIAAAGSSTVTNVLAGYTSLRGDGGAGGTLPTITIAAIDIFIVAGDYWDFRHINFVSSGAYTFRIGGVASKIVNCRFRNTGTGDAIRIIASTCALVGCEAQSVGGIGVNILQSSSNTSLVGCHIHDCGAYGIEAITASGQVIVAENLVAGNVSGAININGVVTGSFSVYNNTLVGRISKGGIGVNIRTGATTIRLFNNIIYGFTSGVVHADAANIGIADYNDYFNNTTDVSNWVKGQNTTSVDPNFSDLAEVSGTTATTSAGTLTDAGANFDNVSNSQDFVYISGGAGVTAGVYRISSHDTTSLTLETDPGDSAGDVSYFVSTGRRYMPSTNLRALGYPGYFPDMRGALRNRGYKDQGALQRREPLQRWNY